MTEVPAFRTSEHLATSDNLLAMLEQVDADLAKAQLTLAPLIETTHRLLSLAPYDAESKQGSYLVSINATDEKDHQLSPVERLYPEPSYNESFYRNDLDKRNWGVVEYFVASHSLDDEPDDSEETKKSKAEYRHAVLKAAQALGFVTKKPKQTHEGIDKRLGIVDGDLEPIIGKVDAIIVPGVAGLSNLKRFRDTVKNIESGAIDTDHIIMTACDRPVTDREKTLLTASEFSDGNTEYELCIAAISDLTNTTSVAVEREFDVSFPSGDYSAKVLSVSAMIGDKMLTIDVLSSPFDHERLLEDGSPAKRAITEETFIAALPLLQNNYDTVVIESHDTWTQCQTVVAERIFGVLGDKNVIGTGPYNADRLSEGAGGEVLLNKAGDVVSEMAKYVYELTKLRVAIVNKLEK